MASNLHSKIFPEFKNARDYRHWEKTVLLRWMAAIVVSSGLLHGLTIGFVSLRSARVATTKPPEPEMEVVIDNDEIPPDLKEALEENAPPTLSGSSGGDESLQVATLTPQQETIAETPLDTAPPEPTPELTDADLKDVPAPTPKPTKTPAPRETSPSQPVPKDATKGPVTQPGEKDGSPSGSQKRGLSQETGKGDGTGGQPGKNGGDGKTGAGSSNDGGSGKKTTPPVPKPPVPKPSTPPVPKPTSTPTVAIVAPPKPPAPPQEPSNPRPKSNYGYGRRDGERLATGTKARFAIEYDENGKVKGGKLAGSTGDSELDAAQLRDFNRALESNDKLRRQLEDRPPEKRDRPIRFVFEGDGENAAEREQIQRNRDLTAQQDAERKAEQAVPAAVPERENPGVLALPIPAPIIDVPPERPAEPPTSAPAVPTEPAAPPLTEPVQPAPAPVEATPVEPAPVEPPPAEPAPVEAAPVEAAPAEPAPVEAAPVEPQPASVEAPPVEAAPANEPAAPPAPEAATP